MPKRLLYVATGGAIVLAIPIVTFISAMVVFPLAFYAILAIIANAGLPIAVLILALRPFGFDIRPGRLSRKWMYCSILWVGCAYGLSHWGDVASSMGAKNTSYVHMLFAPYRLLLGYSIE
jgi:hypothetical protein